ncbi:hypothetical protein ABFS82_13G081300 [Erythranthe guttata]|uniref:Uncharacterized protein n=1 Tax=Erythranthe guttata TaxID=4155 RepID=A0A022R0G2_ERYGU|nr:PREDICTED: uncharacterized proline-rich protein isoform X1 [Erythranthe guttata]EYU33394.1 hypothetical protein MIMGU_mgv1a016483mg [Erythranthe guttata]|eukprot:XP_012842251.1 PREDICTED: uncharacterized proline-rich protein isoform X1 [Erythranthe guttata]
MGELQIQHPFSLPPPPLPPLPQPSSSRDDPATRPSSSPEGRPPPPPLPFDPSRMIGIIRRKALIKELAASYHAECLTYCQELLELQKKIDEQPFTDIKPADEPRKEMLRSRPSKRVKKSR